MTAFLDLPDLASASWGGAALACNDEFFAEKENLLKPEAAVWKDHVYTDRGKWMDGWETRRYRPADGVAPGRDSDVHDWCVIRLGLPGVIRGIVVDTAWFRGNYPAACKIFATELDDALDLKALETATWTELLPYRELAGDTKNTFAIADERRFTHLRLEIYPDGGVARLRVHGEARPQWSRLRALGGAIDLAALEHGAVVETCSDMFFGSRNNLIKPGPSLSMADGWETRRRRGPGNDWAIIKLAATGTIERLLIDTSHFKGNAPALCSVEGVHAPGVAADQLTGWRTLLRSPLQAHTQHVFDDALRRVGPVTHLRLSSYPCGGVARLRAWGTLAPESSAGLARLNAMTADEARAALQRCCGAKRWAEQMAAARPFEDASAMLRVAERVWWSLGESDHREAFAAHARIGDTSHERATRSSAEGDAKVEAKKGPATGDAKWSAGEQQRAAGASAETAAQLADYNQRYDAKHGFMFIVCATGRSAESMLAELQVRLASSTSDELRTAAEEQIKITRLRIGKLISELGA